MKTLAKEHGILIANQNPPGVWEVDTSSNQWTLGSAGGIFISSTYFDLAGMSQREKTLFFEGAAVQEIVNPQYTAGVSSSVGDSMVLVDLMSSSPLTDSELASFYVYGNFAQNVAQSLTFDQTIYGRIRQYVVDLDTAAWGSFVQVSENQIGSLAATASDRVYSYRIVAMGTPTNATRIDVTSARHLLQVKPKEEAEFEYLMRLKRSYELQQSYDED